MFIEYYSKIFPCKKYCPFCILRKLMPRGIKSLGKRKEPKTLDKKPARS